MDAVSIPSEPGGTVSPDARLDDHELDGELSPEEDVVVAARARGLTHEAVGELIGKSTRTARAWAARPRVREEIGRRRREQASEATGLLAASQPAAIACLLAGLGAEKDSDRNRAAQLLLDFSLKFGDQANTDEELAEIRETLHRLGLQRGQSS
jgi:hypothetical protein